MGIVVKIGDVFLIPTEKGYGLGQIVGNRDGELYIIIYDYKAQTKFIDPKEVLSQNPLFGALSLDAKLWHGTWPIIGNVQENLSAIPHPIFKVRYKGIFHIESRDRSVFRPASEEENAKLRFRKVVAPIRIEKALKAHYGIGDWRSDYYELDFSYSLESSRIIETRH